MSTIRPSIFPTITTFSRGISFPRKNKNHPQTQQTPEKSEYISYKQNEHLEMNHLVCMLIKQNIEGTNPQLHRNDNVLTQTVIGITKQRN